MLINIAKPSDLTEADVTPVYLPVTPTLYGGSRRPGGRPCPLQPTHANADYSDVPQGDHPLG